MDQIEVLEDWMRSRNGLVVCYSGGLDSTLLADVAYRALGDRAVAVMVDVPTMSDRQREHGLAIARTIGIPLTIVKLDISDISGILENGHYRCLTCKRLMYSRICEIAKSLDIDTIVNGDNADDLEDERPGMAASDEFGIESPLRKFGIVRSQIVEYIGKLDLPVKMVKGTCILMRFPEGTPVTMDDIRKYERLEADIRSISGLEQLRVRPLGDGVSIQTSTEEMQRLIDSIDEVRKSLTIHVEVNPVPYDK